MIQRKYSTKKQKIVTFLQEYKYERQEAKSLMSTSSKNLTTDMDFMDLSMDMEISSDDDMDISIMVEEN